MIILQVILPPQSDSVVLIFLLVGSYAIQQGSISVLYMLINEMCMREKVFLILSQLCYVSL